MKFGKNLAGVFLLGMISLSACGHAIVYVRQSPPSTKIVEVKPTKSFAKAVWIPGHWKWSRRRHKYIWVNGRWKKVKKERAWINGHWKKTPHGWIWLDGHWK